MNVWLIAVISYILFFIYYFTGGCERESILKNVNLWLIREKIEWVVYGFELKDASDQVT